jgi:hypothetical protein
MDAAATIAAIRATEVNLPLVAPYRWGRALVAFDSDSQGWVAPAVMRPVLGGPASLDPGAGGLSPARRGADDWGSRLEVGAAP